MIRLLGAALAGVLLVGFGLAVTGRFGPSPEQACQDERGVWVQTQDWSGCLAPGRLLGSLLGEPGA